VGVWLNYDLSIFTTVIRKQQQTDVELLLVMMMLLATIVYVRAKRLKNEI